MKLYECEIMDGVKMELLLLNKQVVKILVWQNFASFLMQLTV